MTALLLFLLTLLSPALALAACGTPDTLPAPYDRLARAEALIDTAPDEALDLIDGITLPRGPAARRLLLVQGRGRLGVGDLEHAQVLLLRVLQDWSNATKTRGTPCDVDPGAIRWWMGQVFLAQDQPHEALTQWRSLWSTHVLSPHSEAAEELLRTHDHDFGPREQSLVHERVTSFAEANRHKAGLAFLLERADLSTEQTKKALFAGYFKAKRYGDALQAYPSLAAPTEAERFAFALATSRTGDYPGAAAVYRTLIGGTSALADHASYKLGYLLYDTGQTELAIAAWQEHLERFPQTRHGLSARWFTAWSLFKLGRLEEADTAFTPIAEGRSVLAAGGKYWRARIAGINGDKAGEAAAYEAIIAEHPDSSYAWWAARRSKRTIPPPEEPPPLPAGAPDATMQTALQLIDAGAMDWAAAELRGPIDAARKGGRATSLALGEQLAAVGLWPQARSLMLPHCGAPGDREDLAALRLCWPRPEKAQVDAAGDAVAQHLPYAIMKAESAWTARITSSAGARGLMQLMPDLATAQAAELHPGEPFDPETLYDPAVNVKYGLAELATLTRNLGDIGVEPTLPMVIAAYNGGEGAVRRWLKEQPVPVEADRWAEDISYSETRRYVRRVLGAVQVYRLLYGDAAPAPGP